MKANELRIGNWVCLLEDKQIVWGKEIDGAELNYFPIPLTEEWLVKFGFETYSNMNNQYLTKGSIFFYGKGLLCQVGEYSSIEVSIKYVHSLQNLYFALTGEELEIK